ncbi:unnamed protein product [Rotaria sp. Silwood1]|nr:unnamed protein product [Rotaria sp. Silwood1]
MTSNLSSDVRKCSSSKIILSAARSRFNRGIQELNLFSNNPFWSSALTPAEQIYSTRLYLILILISLLAIISYASLFVRTYDVTLNEFSISDFERLEKRYSTTFKAICSKESIPYSKFLNLSVTFHQICSSSFIEREWIYSLYLSNATSHNVLDFRTFAFSHYRSLSLLCNLAQQTINDNYHSFNSTNLVALLTFSRAQFNDLANVLISNFQNNLLANEKRTAKAISLMIAQNRLMSALRTNYYTYSIPGSASYRTYNAVYLKQNGTNESICDCRLSNNQCTYPAGAFYNWTSRELGKPAQNYPPPLFQIPGLMAGCIPLDAMRQSTLECLYNQSCVDAISFQPKIFRPKALNVSLTAFPLNSTIGSLFDESLFVETWKNQSSFEKYYAACQPQSISYSYKSRFHFGTIITLSLNAFGGLVTVWELITPAIVIIWQRIQWKKQQRQQSTTAEITCVELEIMKMAPKPINEAVTVHVQRTIHNFNLFSSDNKNDPERERFGIIATRLYIFLIIICLIILGFYTSFLKHSHTYTVEKPSLSRFKELHSMYESTLNCPCSRFSMSHARIMSLTPRYHSICSSEFIEDDWLSYFGRVEIDMTIVRFTSADFRVGGQSFFELMRTLCKLSHTTIENALNVFRSNRLVTMNVISNLQFNIETMTRLKRFEQQTIRSFLNLIYLIRSSIKTNQLAEEMMSSTSPASKYINETSKWTFFFRSRHFYTNSCSCGVSDECSRSTGFYFQKRNSSIDILNITIPGLLLGCYAIDSVLLSTLECLYEKNCVKLLVDNYDFDVVGLVRPLNNRAAQIQPLQHENSRFYPNTIISEIVSQAFVEDWINSTNYTSYYERCAPSQCTYTIRKRLNIDILAKMLGFYGGLVIILEIILPLLVRTSLQRWSKHKEKSKPIVSPNNITTDVYRILDTMMDAPCSSPKETNHSFYKTFTSLLSLNLFASDPPLVNKQFQNQEIIATRIYIFLFILCLIVAVIYYGPFNPETELMPIKEPTMDIVNNLHKMNLSSLSCPCSKVAIPYSQILSIKPEYHSICSSEYVSPSYIISLRQKKDNISTALSAHYRLLSSLCQSSHRFIENAKEVFDTFELISVETLTHSSFDSQIQSFISRFISQIPAEYRRTLSFIVGSFSVNQLLHLFRSNWLIDFTDENEQYLLKTFPRNFSLSNCSCTISSNCSEPLIDDIVTGCFPYDGFRLSKFENFSLGKLNDQLFVETWKNTSNYTNYFQICNPLKCQYISSDKNDPIIILTNLLAVYGGLTYGLRLIIGQLLLAYRWWTKHITKKPETNEIS